MADTDIFPVGIIFEDNGAGVTIDALASSLEKLQKANDGIKGIDLTSLFPVDYIKQVGNSFKNLGLGLETISKVDLTKIDSSAISNIAKNIDSIQVTNLSETSSAVSRIGSGLKNLSKIDLSKINVQKIYGLTSALNRLEVPNLTNTAQSLNTMANSMNKLGRVDLTKIDMTAISKSAQDLGKIFTPELITRMQIFSDTLKVIAQNMTTVSKRSGTLSKNLNDIKAPAINVVNQNINNLNKEIIKTETESTRAGVALLSAFGSTRLLNVLKSSFDEAIKFNVELRQISAIAPEMNFQNIGNQLMSLSSSFGNVAKNAEAFYYAYSSGVRGTESELVNFTGQMAGLAQIIRAQVTPTIDAVTTAMNAYGLSTKDATDLMDNFYTIVKYGKASGEQLASGLGQIISTAKTAGLSLNEMGAGITVLTKTMQTRNAITYFNNMIAKMIKPTKESRLAAEKLGLDLSVSAIQAKGFANVMKEIRDATGGSAEALTRLFPDLRGSRAALTLLSTQWEDFNDQLVNFQNKSGEAQKALTALTDNVDYQLSALPNTWNKIKISIGDVSKDIFTLNGNIYPLLKQFNEMDSSSIRLLGGIIGLTTSFVALKTGIFAILTIRGAYLKQSLAIQAQIATEAKTRIASNLAKKKEILDTAALLAMKAKEAKIYAINQQEIARDAVLRYENALAVYKSLPAHTAKNKLLEQEATLLTLKTRMLHADTLAETANANAIWASNAASQANLKTNMSLSKQAKKGIGGVAASVAAGGMGYMVSKSLQGSGSLTKGLLFQPIAKGISTLSISLGKLAGALIPTITSSSAAAGTTALLSSGIGSLGATASAVGLGTTGLVASVAGLGVVTAGAGFGIGYLISKILGLEDVYARLFFNMDDLVKKSNILDSALTQLSENNIFNGSTLIAVSRVNDLYNEYNIEQLSTLQKKYLFEKKLNSLIKDSKKINADVLANQEKKVIDMKKSAIADFNNNKITEEQYNQRIKQSDIEKQKYSDMETKYKATHEQIIKTMKEIDDINNGIDKVEKSISKIKFQRQFNLMDPMEQYNNLVKRLDEETKKLYSTASAIDPKRKEITYKNIDNLRKEIVKNEENRIKNLASVTKKTMEAQNQFIDMQYEMSLQFASSGQERNNILQQKMNKYESEWKSYLVKGEFNKALQSYQKGASIQEQLANAENNANEATMNLVKSLSKFRTTAVESISIYSSEASKLMSRSFETIPTITLQDKQNTALLSMWKNFSEKFAPNLVEKQTELAKANQQFANVMEENKKAAENLTAAINNLTSKTGITSIGGQKIQVLQI